MEVIGSDVLRAIATDHEGGVVRRCVKGRWSRVLFQ